MLSLQARSRSTSGILLAVIALILLANDGLPGAFSQDVKIHCLSCDPTGQSVDDKVKHCAIGEAVNQHITIKNNCTACSLETTSEKVLSRGCVTTQKPAEKNVNRKCEAGKACEMICLTPLCNYGPLDEKSEMTPPPCNQCSTLTALVSLLLGALLSTAVIG